MSEVDVFQLLITLKISKACGHDKIPPKLLQDSAVVIAPILTHIFNQSINTGIFPNGLKTAIISPLYKRACAKTWTMDWTMDDGLGDGLGRWTSTMDVQRPGFTICAKTWTMDDFYLATAVSTNSVSKFSLRLSLCHNRHYTINLTHLHCLTVTVEIQKLSHFRSLL